MNNATKYCLTAILCTLIACLILSRAYLIAHRYDCVKVGYDRDNWTGKIYTWRVNE